MKQGKWSVECAAVMNSIEKTEINQTEVKWVDELGYSTLLLNNVWLLVWQY